MHFEKVIGQQLLYKANLATCLAQLGYSATPG